MKQVSTEEIVEALAAFEDLLQENTTQEEKLLEKLYLFFWDRWGVGKGAVLLWSPEGGGVDKVQLVQLSARKEGKLSNPFWYVDKACKGGFISSKLDVVEVLNALIQRTKVLQKGRQPKTKESL